MTKIPEDSARKAHQITSSRHLNLNQLMKEHFAGDSDRQEARGWLIALFLLEPSYTIMYEYRKKSSTYKKDKPILAILIEEGLVMQTEKTRTSITFKYVGQLSEKEK